MYKRANICKMESVSNYSDGSVTAADDDGK